MHPVLLNIGAFELPTYGVFVAVAWLAGVRWLSARRREMGLSEDELWSLIYWIFAGAFFGGKLFYLALSPDPWSWSISSLRYGFVFYGGLAGTLMAGWWWCRRQGRSFYRTADYTLTALAMGHGIGRLGCLAAGCCYGRHADVPWAVAMAGDLARHPTQLYEALLNFVLFALLSRFAIPRVRDGRWPPGSALWCYVLGYALLRFCIEFFRGDDRGSFHAGLSPSQWVALMSATAVLAILSRRRGA
ncbi:MAG: prolipoprotein diacylglyceryl transferase [Elusimicrobiota bacterium]